MRDFSERQSQLFFLITTFLARYEAPELQALIDDDVAEAMASLAATFETAARGVIYDHRPASVSAERLTAALKPVLAEAGQGAGSAFERDAAVVLRRLEEAVGDVRATRSGQPARVPGPAGARDHDAGRRRRQDPPDRSRLIVP